MEIEKLQQLGLTRNEARIYVTLLTLGSAQAGGISKESQINRTTTYDSIERLLEKGLVSYKFEANIKVFCPVNPNKILEQLKEKEEVAKEILPELSSLFKESKKNKKNEEVNIFNGRIGIRSILNDLLNYKDYVAFGSSGRFLEIMKHDFEIFQKKKRDLKIKARVILGENDRNAKQVKIAHSNFKFVPKEFAAPTTTFIYGNNTAIIVWGETPIAILIKSEEVVETNRKHFELLWKIAKHYSSQR